LVHNHEAQINRLIRHLSADFDVYVHIDKRSSLRIEASEHVFVCQEYKTYWASYNLVKATLCLLRKAFKKGYDRYILISGQDLPLKSNEELKAFFKDNHTEYLDIARMPLSGGWPNIARVKTYHLPYVYFGVKNLEALHFFTRVFAKLLKWIAAPFPRKLDYDFHAGSQWITLTHNCVDKMFAYMEKDRHYEERYRWTHCPDEIFFQTLLHLLDGIHIEANSRRYIDWETGPESPRILRKEDYEKIMANPNNLFARKFDASKDAAIIERVYERIAR
jgi:hypothetical protein